MFLISGSALEALEVVLGLPLVGWEGFAQSVHSIYLKSEAGLPATGTCLNMRKP